MSEGRQILGLSITQDEETGKMEVDIDPLGQSRAEVVGILMFAINDLINTSKESLAKNAT